MASTIADVAERAGVSTATVSRVLTGADGVRETTRRRVLDAVEELDYRPSAVARSLRRQATATLGLIVTDITNPFYPELVRGVEDEAQDQGCSVLLCNSTGDPDREAAYLDLMIERRVEALIVASGGLTLRHTERLVGFPVPVVLVNVESPDDRLPAVASDDRAGAQMAVAHLQDCGYGPIAHIAGPDTAGRPSGRLEGVLAATGGEALVVAGDGHFTGGRAATRKILAELGPPFGIFAHNDLSAVGALAALHVAGVEVPGEVGVVGFDDIALSAYANPPLTTVAQDKYAMGAWAVRAAQQQLNGRTPAGTHLLDVELVERGSTVKRVPEPGST